MLFGLRILCDSLILLLPFSTQRSFKDEHSDSICVSVFDIKPNRYIAKPQSLLCPKKAAFSILCVLLLVLLFCYYQNQRGCKAQSRTLIKFIVVIMVYSVSLKRNSNFPLFSSIQSFLYHSYFVITLKQFLV